MDQLQRSLMLQQQNDQLLASPLGASSSLQLPFQQQQLQPLDPLLQHTLQARQQLQLQGLPPPRINSTSANVAARSAWREEGTDEEQSEPEDERDTS